MLGEWRVAGHTNSSLRTFVHASLARDRMCRMAKLFTDDVLAKSCLWLSWRMFGKEPLKYLGHSFTLGTTRYNAVYKTVQARG